MRHFLKTLLCAFTTGLASFYAATSWAQSKTENCYFSIDYETIFNGPCNETISEIEKNFETRYEQIVFAQGISSGEEHFAYILEEQSSNSPYSYFDPSFYSVYWNGGGGNHAHSFLGLGMMNEGKPRCIESTEISEDIASSLGVMGQNLHKFQVCWSDFSDQD